MVNQSIVSLTDVIASERGGGDRNGEASETVAIVLNADAVYITSYAVLHLSYGLFQSGYYDSAEPSLPVSEVTNHRSYLICSNLVCLRTYKVPLMEKSNQRRSE